jgi:hypothetical protein
MDKQQFMNVAVPLLNIDVDCERELSPNQRNERRVLAALLTYLAENGIVPAFIDDGEDRVKVDSIAEVMELVFNLDDCVLYVKPINSKARYGIRLIQGNSWWELVADNALPVEDPKDFAGLMDKFTNLMIDLSEEVFAERAQA